MPNGKANAHAGSRTRVTSMGGLYDAATLHALWVEALPFVKDLRKGNGMSMFWIGLS